MYEIQYIAAATDESDLFLTGAWEHTISVWSFRQRRKISEFETVLSPGGTRLGVTNGQHPIVVAGAYDNGICGYDAHTGRQLWERIDITKSQRFRTIKHSSDDILIGIGREFLPYHFINVEDGSTVKTLVDTDDIYTSLRVKVAVHETPEMVGLSNLPSWEVRWWSKMRRVLDVALNTNAIVISLAEKPVCCLDFDGTNLWTWKPEEGYNVLAVSWHEALRRWHGIYWCYEVGGPRFLIAWDEDGSLVSKKAIDTPDNPVWEQAFFSNGEYLITSSGEILSIPDLQLVWKFAE